MVCAWVTLVMRGDDYVPGAVVLAQSLRWAATKHQIVCMITNDVSPQAKRELEIVFDHVVLVPYIRVELSPALKTARQTRIYGEWSKDSFTKWNCLAFAQYEKLCFVDADMMLLRNCDHLMRMLTPAGTFSNPYMIHSKQIKNVHSRTSVVSCVNLTDALFSAAKSGEKRKLPSEMKRETWQRNYPIMSQLMPRHGQLLSARDVLKGLTHNGVVANAGLVVLTPNRRHFDDFRLWANAFPKNDFSATCYSSKDEQVLASFYSDRLNQPWYHISCGYQYLTWKPDWNDPEHPPAIVHYMMRKPWSLWKGAIERPEKASEFRQWTDAGLWWSVAQVCGKLNPSFHARLGKEAFEAYALDKTRKCFMCDVALGKPSPVACPVHEFAPTLWMWTLVHEYLS